MRFVLCGLLAAASALLLWQALGIPGAAGAYPMAVTAGTLVLSLAHALRQALAEAGAWAGAEGFALPRGALVRVAVFAAVWASYVLSLSTLGFLVATTAALFASLVAVRPRPRLLDAPAVALFTLVLAVLMKVVLYVPVPQGPLDERLDLLIHALR